MLSIFTKKLKSSHLCCEDSYHARDCTTCTFKTFHHCSSKIWENSLPQFIKKAKNPFDCHKPARKKPKHFRRKQKPNQRDKNSHLALPTSSEPFMLTCWGLCLPPAPSTPILLLAPRMSINPSLPPSPYFSCFPTGFSSLAEWPLLAPFLGHYCLMHYTDMCNSLRLHSQPIFFLINLLK